MKEKLLFFILALLCGGAFAVFAQTAEQIDTISAERELSVGSAAYVAAGSAGLLADTDGPEEALALLAERGYPVARVSPATPVRIDHFAYMLMLAHERPGGLLYTLFPGPRYAFRQFEFERLLRLGGDPNHTITGTRALQITGRLLSTVEAEG